MAFAANSVLCRLALHDGAIDAASFTAIRVVSGAAMLLLVTLPGRIARAAGGNWIDAAWLTLYALPFAFAYTRLSTGTGALILFGTVQVTMQGAALAAGERLHPIQWLGAAAALTGLVALVLPGLTAPEPLGALLMAVAALGWAFYSLRGRGTPNPLAHTRGNFLRSVPLVCAASLLAPAAHAETRGIVLATVSGAVTSGLGYVVWYALLRRISATQAAVVQLAGPVLAAAGGVLLLSEAVSLRLVLSSVMVLGGIALVVVRKPHPAAAPSDDNRVGR